MKTYIALIVPVLAICSTTVFGHGTPIKVNVDDGQLVASHPPDPEGFPPGVFAEDDEDGIPFGSVPSPQFGPIVVWNLPGLNIYDMDPQSSLSIEPLPQSVRTESPSDKRLVWYWNPTTEEVEEASREMHLLGTGQRSRLLEPAPSGDPDAFLLADPLTADEIGFHNHGLVNYALADDPTAPAGAYGFYARLTSDSYAPSDPFLLVFNNGVTEYDRMIDASLAIDLATGIGGDHNADGNVFGDDFLVWQRAANTSVTPGSGADSSGDGLVDAEDLALWNQNYGYATPSGASSVTNSIVGVPEPATVALLLVSAGLALLLVRNRLEVSQ